MKNKEFAHIHLHTEHCLAGDTVIYNCVQNGKNNRKDYTLLRNCKTIKYLWGGQEGKGRGYTSKKYPIKVWDEKRFVASKIKKIQKSNPKQLYKLTTESGKTIRCSIDHKFLCKDGWKRLSEILVGQKIACNGKLYYQDRDWLYQKYFTENLNQQQIADLCGVSRNVIKRLIKIHKLHKTKHQWMMGHYVADETRQKNSLRQIKKRNLKEKAPSLSASRLRIQNGWYGDDMYVKCEKCSNTKNLLVHHKNRDPLDNRKSNLETLCKSCHEFEHSPYPLVAKYEKIISIKKDGFEETYDIEVYHKAHNFVANGIITHNSALDGFGTTKKYTEQAKKLGFEYLGCTDHGNIDGTIEFQRECNKQGIKSIIGAELYVVPDMTKKIKGEKKGHLTVLVKNQKGWHTLCRWLTKANLDGFYSRPRCDFNQILESDLDGLIFMTACAGSVIKLPKANQFMHDLRDKAGEDNVLMEIMPHEMKFQHELHDIIKKQYDDWPLIASNDCHYVKENDWEAQEVLLAIQSRSTWNDPKRWKFGFKGLHLRTADEMVLAFKRQGDFDRGDILDAMGNALDIAKECSNFKIEKMDISLPEVPYDMGTDDEFEYMKQCCKIGMHEFGVDRKTEYKKRLQEELDLIEKKGFAKYFLIVQDFINHCKTNGWGVGPGRGSVGGSLIAHLLHITTKCDPIKYGLSFSRFLSENRIDWPDVDIDVEKRYRQQAVDFLYETYGEKRVCGISTDMRMKSKAIIRDVGRVFEIPGYDVNAMAKCIWEGEHEEGSAIQKAVDRYDEAKDFADKYPKELEFMLALEGQKRGCIDGDCRVILKHGKISKHKKLKHLYTEKYKGKIRYYDFDKKRLAFENIKNIWQSGIKHIYQITTTEKKHVNLTADHRLLTKSGWKQAKDIQVGEFIATNGHHVNSGSFKKGQVPWNKGKKGLQVAWNKGLKKEDNPIIMASSERMKKQNPSKTKRVKKLISQHSFKHGKYSLVPKYRQDHPNCEVCLEKATEEIHHIDKNPKNNKDYNLLAVCIKCHHKIHNINKKWDINKINPSMTIKWNRVLSFKYIGKKMTYDIEMKGKHQNFICNKIICHNSGRHAAGIVISGDDLTDGTRCALTRRSKNIVCNWTMKDAEYRGLMKLDVLGLATISVIKEAERLIKESDKNFTIDNIPEGDQETFALIGSGQTAGIFQISGKPLTELCKEMGIETFTHIRDANALVRPGPTNSGQTGHYIKRKHGKEKVEKIHPIYDKITEETYGVALFQEQISAIISQMAGTSESDADQVRKIISKKKDPSEFLPYKKQFVDGCKKQNTFSPKQAEKFWEGLQEFSKYCFNSAHATAYGVLAYDTAYLKTHYPTEFIAATLTYGEYHESSRDPNKHKQYIINEAKEFGLSIMPPKLNISDPIRWIAKGDTLYAPFIELKGIGESTANKCMEDGICKKPKQKGFFKMDAKPKSKTKIEQILDEIEANDPEAIPDTKDYLPFECFKQRGKKRTRPKSIVESGPLKLSECKIKEAKYRNENVIDCQDCDLRKEATEPILSSCGQYNVIICLDAPDEQEDEGIKSRSGSIMRMGAIGPAGNLLWDYLAKYDVQRRHVHLTNICRCFPSKTKTPKKKHIDTCIQWLKDELKHLDAKLILACGNTCVKAFTDKTGGINALSGKRQWMENLQAWVVWCNHPSSVLRNKVQNEPIFKKGIKAFANAFEELKK